MSSRCFDESPLAWSLVVAWSSLARPCHDILNRRLRLGLTALLVAGAVPGLGQTSNSHVGRGPINLPEITRRADSIVRGFIAASRADWVDRTIYTFYDLVVSETIKGATRTRITIAVPGGAAGNVRTVWPGAPELVPGDEVIFFGTPFRGTSFTAVGLFDGVVEVTTDPATGRRLVAPRGRPENVEDFLREVRSLSRR